MSAAAPARRAAASAAVCGNCAHFRADPLLIERFVPGLRSFGSGFAAVRADDGLCLHHGRYLSANSSCADHVGREGTDSAARE